MSVVHEQVLTTMKDNIEFFPNIVLYRPLDYIMFADENNELKLSCADYDVVIRYKFKHIDCIETESQCLGEYV